MKLNSITACTAKKWYETELEAKNTADYLWANKGVSLTVYKCPLCEGFHLSSRVDE